MLISSATVSPPPSPRYGVAWFAVMALDGACMDESCTGEPCMDGRHGVALVCGVAWFAVVTIAI